MGRELDRSWQSRFPSRQGLYLIQRDNLIARYNAPGRYYHTWAHIERMLSDLYEGLMFATYEDVDYTDSIERAILYHDLVYVARPGSNNEDLSSLACEEATGDYIATLMIRDTATHLEVVPESHRAFFLSLDLLSLADPYEEFQKAGDLIIEEYERESFNQYAPLPPSEGRLKILPGRIEWMKTFLKRPYIFPHWYFEQEYSQKARINLDRSIYDLTQELEASK